MYNFVQEFLECTILYRSFRSGGPPTLWLASSHETHQNLNPSKFNYRTVMRVWKPLWFLQISLQSQTVLPSALGCSTEAKQKFSHKLQKACSDQSFLP